VSPAGGASAEAAGGSNDGLLARHATNPVDFWSPSGNNNQQTCKSHANNCHKI